MLLPSIAKKRKKLFCVLSLFVSKRLFDLVKSRKIVNWKLDFKIFLNIENRLLIQRFHWNSTHRKNYYVLIFFIVIRNGHVICTLLIFLLEIEISGVAVQRIYQNSEKQWLFVRNYSVKMTLRLFCPLTVVMTKVLTLLRQLRISLQIKKIITSAVHVL